MGRPSKLTPEEIAIAFDFGAQFVADDAQTKLGWKIGGNDINGRALLPVKTGAIGLVYRLKDDRPLRLNEIEFWGWLLANLIPPDTRWITHAPSSMKCPANEHLATLLAGFAAKAANDSASEHFFVNNSPRGHRATMHEKLRETKNYTYSGPRSGDTIVVVDDVICTRSTAIACQAAAWPDICYFVVLCEA